MDQAAATARRKELRANAQRHKRAAAYHREQTKVAMRRLADFERFCREAGITLDLGSPIDPNSTREIVREVQDDLQHTYPTTAPGGKGANQDRPQARR